MSITICDLLKLLLFAISNFLLFIEAFYILWKLNVHTVPKTFLYTYFKHAIYGIYVPFINFLIGKVMDKWNMYLRLYQSSGTTEHFLAYMKVLVNDQEL